MSVKDRLKKFTSYTGLSVSRFEKSIGVANGYVNSISKSIGLEKIEAILEKYPNLSIEWLITGRGNMIRPPGEEVEGDILNEPQAVYKTARDIETENTLLKQEKKFLNKEIEYLKNEISLKDKIIKLLENK